MRSLPHGWQEHEILVTVKAYPEPSKKYQETVCVAGTLLDTMEPIRIYPVTFRDLLPSQQFQRYQVIRASILKNPSDARPESHYINHQAPITIMRSIKDWASRDPLLAPWRAMSIEQLLNDQREQGQASARSLALIRPKEVSQFLITADSKNWTERQQQALRSPRLFDTPSQRPRRELQKVPFRFQYRFVCNDDRCDGHTFSLLDWEAGRAYLKFVEIYGDGWRDKMEDRFWRRMLDNTDLQFLVGTIKNHPLTWSIIGIYYPKIGAIPQLPEVTNLKLPGFE